MDYCILNEVEASKVTGVKVREDGKLLEEGIEEASSKLFELGARELIVIHFPEGSFAQSASGEKGKHASLALPRGYIKGAAGAGDAFCSGVLYGVHENWSLEKCLLTGTCAATAGVLVAKVHVESCKPMNWANGPLVRALTPAR